MITTYKEKMQPTQTLKKAQSFQIIEDMPECRTPYDKRIQEVIRPAMLVVSANGSKFLLFQEDSPNLQTASRDATPLNGQPQQEYPK